jgi:NAD-dependent SIR2 family protein deacetylase
VLTKFLSHQYILGFFRRLPELNGHLCEMHGSVEEYVCSSSMGFVHSANPSTNGSLSIITPEYEPRRSAIWDKWNGKTTPEQRNICRQKLYSSKNLFSDRCVDESDSCGTEIDLDKCRTAICTDCRLPLRPKVIMFGDACPCVMNWYEIFYILCLYF